MGCLRSRTSNGYRPVCIRHWHCSVYLHQIPGSAEKDTRCTSEKRTFPRDHQLLCSYLSATVHYEFWYSGRTGSGQQLWHYHHGSICRSGEDRCICLSSRTGFRKCIFHLYCPELWGKTAGAHQKRNPNSGHYFPVLRTPSVHSGMLICSPSDESVY